MISVPQVICIFSCGFGLCLGPSPAAEAHNKVVTACATIEQLNGIAHGGQSKGGLTIKDDVLHVGASHDFVRVPESKEGRLRIDGTTPRAGKLELGNRIKARMKDQDEGYCMAASIMIIRELETGK